MATRKSFQRLASKLINKTFGDFRDAVVFTELGEFDYALQTTAVTSTENTFGIRSTYDQREIDGTNIQVGDYKILVESQSVTMDIRADNVGMTFNGKAVDIVNVSEDAARAVLTIQARDQ